MKKPETLDTPTVDKLLKTLLVLARSVDHTIETQAVTAAVDKPLSQSKVQIIRLLGQRGAHISTQLSRFLGVSKPAVTQIIDSMVRAKLVVRRPTTHDRREIAVELTPTGRETFRAIRRKQRHLTRTLARHLGEKNVNKWLRQLDELNRALVGANRAMVDYCLQCGAHDDKSCILIGGEGDCQFTKHSNKRSTRQQRKQAAKF